MTDENNWYGLINISNRSFNFHLSGILIQREICTLDIKERKICILSEQEMTRQRDLQMRLQSSLKTYSLSFDISSAYYRHFFF